MARSFTTASSQYAEYAGAVVTAVPLTVSAWVYPTSFAAGQGVAGVYASSTAGDILSLQLVVTTGAARAAARAGGGASQNASSTTNCTANVWNHVCATFTSATSRAAYVNGGGKGTNAGSATPASLNTTSVGRVVTTSPASYFAGRIAEVAIWNVALTDAEVAALGGGVPARLVRPGSLVGYWPLIGIDSPERDWTANNHQLTLGAAPPAANHAPVGPYSSRFWGSAPLIAVSAVSPLDWLPEVPDFIVEEQRAAIAYH